MDTRYSPEQLELRGATAALASDLGPGTVADLDDRVRQAKLAAAGADAGWFWLRAPGDGSGPLASGVEVGIVARELARVAADAPFFGPVVASELGRVAGVELGDAANGTVLERSLVDFAIAKPNSPVDGIAVDGIAVDCAGLGHALVLVGTNDHAYRIARVDVTDAEPATDLTRAIATVNVDHDGLGVVGDAFDRLAVDRARALALSITVAELLGSMEGVLDATCAYAQERQQFGVAIGSFQAVQHLLAEARVLLDGAISVASYAAWAVDSMSPADALEAGSVAKAYCTAAARTVCETAIQVHGGIGNTWECFVHVHLRRALFSSALFGDEGHHLHDLARRRMGYGLEL